MVNKSGLVVNVVPHDVHRELADFILVAARYWRIPIRWDATVFTPTTTAHTHKFWLTASVLWRAERFGSGPVECGFQIILGFTRWKDNLLNRSLPHKLPDFVRKVSGYSKLVCLVHLEWKRLWRPVTGRQCDWHAWYLSQSKEKHEHNNLLFSMLEYSSTRKHPPVISTPQNPCLPNNAIHQCRNGMHKVCAHVFVTLQLRVGAQNCCYTVHTSLVSLTACAILLRRSVSK